MVTLGTKGIKAGWGRKEPKSKIQTNKQTKMQKTSGIWELRTSRESPVTGQWDGCPTGIRIPTSGWDFWRCEQSACT